ncbi:MAG: hypothetical protein HYX65_08310 [Gemmatimonadetes bacterium]|nr:hypothetical protein [Gemmatimonadota bacterium]
MRASVILSPAPLIAFAVPAVAVLALVALPALTAASQAVPVPARNDSLLMPADPSRSPFGDTLRPVRRRPVTAVLDASAYATPQARTLIQRARVARLRVDSALRSYHATSYRRATVGIGIRSLGAERVLYRQESSGEVRWERGIGAQVTVTGQREAAPLAPGTIRSSNPVAFPYFPGKDALWVGGATIAREEVDETRLVHPIALGAEAYYTYAIGDSVQMLLPGGQRIVLRELRVTPRTPDWHVFVGSFWFDEATAQLVRATYRVAAEADLTSQARNSIARGTARVPFMIRQLAFPIRAELSVINIEHGLYEGRFWLPRSHTAAGAVKLNLGRLPLVLEEKFAYRAVNGDAPLPALADAPSGLRFDTLDRVPAPGRSAAARAMMRAQQDDRARQCAQGPTWKQRQLRYSRSVETLVEIPCDTVALARSPSLPPQMFEAAEKPFAVLDEAAGEKALGLARQSGYEAQPPRFSAGITDGLLRFNRVEGLSAGVGYAQVLGMGFAVDAKARIGTGDRWPQAELGLARTTGARTERAAVFARLVSLSDWGTPFGFSESLQAAAIARDEGFYARAWGAEYLRTLDASGASRLRLFVEGEGTAAVTTRWSLREWGDDPRVRPNVAALEGTWAGAELRGQWSWGADPLGLRTRAEVRAEGAGGATSYGRLALEGGASTSLGPLFGGMTVGVGSAVGTLPPQRAWFLGGARTVRGQVAGTMTGDAFWLARAEIGPRWPTVRPSLFYDVGWAGARTADLSGSRPMSGAGVGLSFVDGLLRLDVANGIWPRSGPRVDLSIDVRF